jgi:hypothetical protein
VWYTLEVGTNRRVVVAFFGAWISVTERTQTIVISRKLCKIGHFEHDRGSVSRHELYFIHVNPSIAREKRKNYA